MTPLEEIKFWQQILGDLRRTIVCSPDAESLIKTGLEARGIAGLNTVVVSRYCPDGSVFIFDEQGLEAYYRASVQRWGRQWQ